MAVHLLVLRFIQFCCTSFVLCIMFGLLKTCKKMNFRIINVILLEKMKAISFLEVEDFTDSLFGMEMLKTCLKQIWLDYFKTMQKGIQVESNSLFLCPLPTTTDDCNKESAEDLMCEEDREQQFFPGTEILDLAELSQKDVPLVLNFGSCS